MEKLELQVKFSKVSEVFGVRFSVTLLRKCDFSRTLVQFSQPIRNKLINSVAHFFPRLNPFKVTSHLRRRPSGKKFVRALVSLKS